MYPSENKKDSINTSGKYLYQRQCTNLVDNLQVAVRLGLEIGIIKMMYTNETILSS